MRDVVTVSAGQRHRERDALSVNEDMMLAARTCAIDRAGPAFEPRRAALTWLESITAPDQSSCFAARSCSSNRTWRRSTPASFQAASRRQHVMPDPKPSSWGRYSHWMPVCRRNRIPYRACRSGTRGRPATSFGPGSGNNGSISEQFVRHPRTRVPSPHEQTKEHVNRWSHHHRLLYGPLRPRAVPLADRSRMVRGTLHGDWMGRRSRGHLARCAGRQQIGSCVNVARQYPLLELSYQADRQH
ncbi:hypothetical protein FBY37_2119 [Streptomyces sp. SLBN-134]|nr:hypothetical protein FBY37_2119 [Streptomyces sp. SLBN-134]